MGKRKSYFTFKFTDKDVPVLEDILRAWLMFQIGRSGWTMRPQPDKSEGTITWTNADWLSPHTQDERFASKSGLGWPWDYVKLFINRDEHTVTLGRHEEHDYIAAAIVDSFRKFLDCEEIPYVML